MICAWDKLLAILPHWLRQPVNDLGKETLQELRLRCNAPPELVLSGRSQWLQGNVSQPELTHIVNAASSYSPWAASTLAKGYLTAPGGHRIGVCGEVVCKAGRAEGVREISSLCIRVARDFPGIGTAAPGSTLILGAPGWGKTTLLRDVIRKTAETRLVCVVDERGELFPEGICRGKRCDVLTGCSKEAGLEMALRCMGPEFLAVDEITAQEDVQAMLHCVHCGVSLLATAHAASMEEFVRRPVYEPLLVHKVFSTLLILDKDKHYTLGHLQ